MQYDFNLVANGGTTLAVAGKFFKYKSGTGAIRIRTSGGGYVDLLPGQGVWNVDFSMLQIIDASGAANKGVILAGNFDFHDDRITGTVDVMDSGKVRTFQNLTFSGALLCPAEQGKQATCQLWNPIGSGKNVYVQSATFSSSISNFVRLGWNTAANGTLLGGCLSKKSGGNESNARIVASALDTLPIGFQYLGLVIIPAATAFLYTPKEPVLISPGFGFNLQHSQFNTAELSAIIEMIEEVI